MHLLSSLPAFLFESDLHLTFLENSFKLQNVPRGPLLSAPARPTSKWREGQADQNKGMGKNGGKKCGNPEEIEVLQRGGPDSGVRKRGFSNRVS